MTRLITISGLLLFLFVGIISCNDNAKNEEIINKEKIKSLKKKTKKAVKNIKKDLKEGAEEIKEEIEE